MARMGYGAFAPENFTGFLSSLTSGAWATVRNVDPAASPSSSGVLPVYKALLTARINQLVAAQGASNDVSTADAPWDDAERRFVLSVQIKTLDADPTVRRDAERVQAALCPHGSTAMTRLDPEDEIDYARNQLLLARSPAYETLVRRLGLEAPLAEIERLTDELQRAVDGDRGGVAQGPRSRKVLRAAAACAAAFKHVHEGLEMLMEFEADGAARARLEALLDPFERLITRRPEVVVEVTQATDKPAVRTG